MWIDLAMLSLCAMLSIPVGWLCIQIALGLAKPAIHLAATETTSTAAPRVVVLIPAHNESINILPTLRSVMPQLQVSDRVLVVADNCSDDTADAVRAFARTHQRVDVIERMDTTRRGKGYALAYGLDHLAQQDAPDVVLVLDADCILAQGGLSTLSHCAQKHQRPAQALYLMHHPAGASLQARLAEWAWRVKNLCRPRGLQRLSAGCQLTGTGMAFPWPIVGLVPWASGHLVEDMKLGLDFAAAGHAPLLVEQALVDSQFPTREDTQRSQRTRWEHGHLSMLIQDGLPAVLKGLLRGNWRLLALGLDICIPPLALLVLLNLLALGGSLLWCAIHPTATAQQALLWGLANLCTLAVAILAAWYAHGRHNVPFNALLRIPLYILRKVPVYAQYLYKRQMDWVRSRRD